MRSFGEYFPAMRETPGRLFYVPRVSFNTIVAAAALAGGLAWAYHYPAVKVREATRRLVQYNELTMGSMAATQASINHLPGLVASSPGFVQSLAKDSATRLQTRLAGIRTVSVDQIRIDTQHQRDAYAKAQALIASSPFRGLPVDRVPAGSEGQAYLDALKLTPPPRLEYQQLEAGALDALGMYRAALEVETLAANLEHQFDIQVNGRKAAPARTVLAPATPENNTVPPDSPAPATAGAAGQNEAMSRYFGSKGTTAGSVTASSPAATSSGDPSDVARQIEAERKWEVAAKQAKERAEQLRQLAAQQVRDRPQQVALFRQQQAEQARLAQQQADRAAAAEKARECTSSLLSRAICAWRGYTTR
ncbi:hypothetical protein [Paraburkholderia humisilvae]|uniref:Uncharacterized protein n=1 Tax=Paraburkholderia humisilvae TaxID=627669 RepID=A0A6J5F6M9_9BURK|nr:hypothetical protein [Paraburkholderia humisilvae]CAB3774459.1 hypothetical protein LMG29542_07836 [Paraburkholderia humisilvae]